jgi:poly(A) polymerase
MTDLTPYAGRWVALIGAEVVGVGHTADEASHLARRNRPRERPLLRFVEAPGGEPLPLSPLLARLRPLLDAQAEPVYLVGGAVRDALLGRTSHDLDFVAPQQAIKLAYRVGDALGEPAYALDRARDTGRVVLSAQQMTLDFARFRGVDLEADLRDRDFTVNALALPATAQTLASLIDPCGGLADLRARRLRLTHPAALTHDPVRALRAVRLAHSLGFTLEEATAQALTAAAPLLAQTSAERVRDELLKLLQTAAPHAAMQDLHALGLLAVVLPEIAALAGVAQSPPHHEPVLDHTLSVLRRLAQVETAVLSADPLAPPLTAVRAALAPFAADLRAHLARPVAGGVDGRLLLRLGALFHDVGKPATQTVEDGRIRFIGHDKVGAGLAAGRLRALAMSKEAAGHVRLIVAHHMRPLFLVEAQLHGSPPSRRAVYRFFRAAQAAGPDVALLALADHLATHAGAGPAAAWRALVDLAANLLQAYFVFPTEAVKPAPLLKGRDLMAALDLPPGPEVGRLLRLIEEAQAAGELRSRDEALAFARRSRQ